MSAYFRHAGRRANLYTGSRASDRPQYNPFYAEGISAWHRFADRLEKPAAFPRLIELPTAAGFIQVCSRDQVSERLAQMPPGHLEELRAVFLLGGRRKQLRSWHSDLACYGFYWNDCVFLCAHPQALREQTRAQLCDYYLEDVLVHEVAHHIDRHRDAPEAKKENFANGFVEQGLG